jgi:hypothetical protein
LQTFLVSINEIGLKDEKLAELRQKLLAKKTASRVFPSSIRKLAGAHALTKRWMKRTGLLTRPNCPLTFSSEEVGMVLGEPVESYTARSIETPITNTCSGTVPDKPGMNTPGPAIPAGRAIPKFPGGSHLGNEDLTTGIHGNGNHIHYGCRCHNSPADSGNPAEGGGNKGVVANVIAGGEDFKERGGNPVPSPGTTGARRGTTRLLGGLSKELSHEEKLLSVLGGEKVSFGSSLKGKILDLSKIGNLTNGDICDEETSRAIQKLLRTARRKLKVDVLVDPRDSWTAIAGILGNADDKQYKLIAEKPRGNLLLIELVLRRARKRNRIPRTPPPVDVDAVLSWTRPSKRALFEHEVSYTKKNRQRNLEVHVLCTNPMLARTESVLRFVTQQASATAVPSTKLLERLVLDPGMRTKRPELTYWLGILRREFTCERDGSWLVFRPKLTGTEAL